MAVSETWPEATADGEFTLVEAAGELDLLTTPGFALELTAALRRPGSPHVVVDLTAVTFMDVSPLRALCRALAEARERQGWLRLVHTLPLITRLLRATGLAEEFPRYASVRNALADLPEPSWPRRGAC